MPGAVVAALPGTPTSLLRQACAGRTAALADEHAATTSTGTWRSQGHQQITVTSGVAAGKPGEGEGERLGLLLALRLSEALADDEGDRLADTLALGLLPRLGLGLALEDGLRLGLTLADGLRLRLALELGDTLALGEGEADAETDGLTEDDADALGDGLGEADGLRLGLTLALGDVSATATSNCGSCGKVCVVVSGSVIATLRGSTWPTASSADAKLTVPTPTIADARVRRTTVDETTCCDEIVTATPPSIAR